MVYRLGILLLLLLSLSGMAYSQSDLAAIMVVNGPTVEVQRTGTNQWIAVQVEAIVGVGDTIRTDATGTATITFFETGMETDLASLTTYRIDAFNETDDEGRFNLLVSVVAGQTQQRVERALDAGSTYEINTPGTTLAARGTAFDIRVEASGRSALLVTEGNVDASAEGQAQMVPTAFGVRSEAGAPLSDVVRASTFAELDAALDGCMVAVRTTDDVRLNVRLGPGTDFARVGTVAAEDITNVKGVIQGGAWYRIDFRGGFGWILVSDLTVEGDCAGLRQFEPEFGPEDPALIEFTGDPIELDATGAPQAQPAPTDEAANEVTGEG
jgi:hypothetical protein